ncbi:MAG: hypothetical protein H6605_10210 [Flavobacteriales bacterium]|nr:hypothetical protein [Flavobacteriales bacterium]
MNNTENSLNDLNEIRKMMERSSKFISLSGLSGVIVGVTALIGAAVAKYKLNGHYSIGEQQTVWNSYLLHNLSEYSFYILDATIVLIVAIGAGILPTIARAKKFKQNIFHPVAYRMFANLLIPIAAGGVFCLLLFNYSIFGLIAPAMLIFYGLGLVNASHYTLSDIRYLGFIQIILGVINGFYAGEGLYFWALGFGIMHIVYGLYLYFKYERNQS